MEFETNRMKSQPTKKELDNEVWYRILKVLWWIAIAGAIIGSLLIANGRYEVTEITPDRHHYVCVDGSIGGSGIIFNPLIGRYEAGTPCWDQARQTLVIDEEAVTTNNISEAALVFVVSLLVNLAILFILRFAFFYIVYGKKPKKE